jgi:hypothetical protein
VFQNICRGAVVCTSMWHMKRKLRRSQGVTRRRRPRLTTSDQYGRIITYICFTAVFPTPLMFGVFWVHISRLRMVRGVWGLASWVTYFVATYMREVDLGGRVLYDASWHYGAAARPRHGAPPSQQPVEQSHANFKRAVQGAGTLKNVLVALRRAVAAWCGRSLRCAPIPTRPVDA